MVPQNMGVDVAANAKVRGLITTASMDWDWCKKLVLNVGPWKPYNHVDWFVRGQHGRRHARLEVGEHTVQTRWRTWVLC